MNIGLLGLKHFHVWNYAQAFKSMADCNIGCAYDSDSRLLDKAKEHTGARIYQDLQTLLRKEEPGIAVVCSSNASHAEITVQAAAAGWHILCEKPMATSLDDCYQMKQACVEAGVCFGLALPMRHSGPIKKAQAFISSGLIGNPVLVKTTNRGKLPMGWFLDKTEAGGGAIVDHTIHTLDIMRWLVQSEVERVYAVGGNLLHKLEVEDVGLIQVLFRNGVVGTIDASWSRPRSFPTWGDVTLEITGDTGYVYVDSFAQSFLVYSDSELQPGSTTYWGVDPNNVMIGDFVDAVKERRPFAVGADDGIRAFEVTQAAYQSLASGRPVDLV
jgi:predicted dehydrogenase